MKTGISKGEKEELIRALRLLVPGLGFREREGELIAMGTTTSLKELKGLLKTLKRVKAIEIKKNHEVEATITIDI
ncbi:hypothetical protein KAR26_01280 [Candidatus Parcubacteria bacterium]|nr:hypothetical protein [Candidatus Parcubacteria bacterium]